MLSVLNINVIRKMQQTNSKTLFIISGTRSISVLIDSLCKQFKSILTVSHFPLCIDRGYGQGNSIEGHTQHPHPAVTATACVALWSVLQSSEQARAVARDAGHGTGAGGGAGEGGGLVRMLRESDRDSNLDEIQGREKDRRSPYYWDEEGRTSASKHETASSIRPAGKERERERECLQHLSCTTQNARRALLLLLESDGPRS